MGAVALQLTETPSVSIPLGAVILVFVGLMLLAMALGGLLTRRLRMPRIGRPDPRQTGRTSQPASAESSSRQNVVLNALPFPAAVVSRDGHPLAVNHEAEFWLETSSPPHLASPLHTLARRVANTREAEAVQVTLIAGQPPLRVHASPLLGGHSTDATLLGVLLLAPSVPASTSRDLTRLVAHELRTPLTAIVGHAEILESCDPAEEALWRRSRDFIVAEAQRLARLVDDLLALSRLEASPPLLRTVNLRAVVESALSRLFDCAEAGGLALTLEAPASLPRVRADRDRLEQALVNLLDNAIKYTPPGGTVTARLISESTWGRYHISYFSESELNSTSADSIRGGMIGFRRYRVHSIPSDDTAYPI